MREFELAALDSVKSFLKRASSRHAPPPGTLCANCDTELAGLYCHACGQAADNHHRNLWHLIWEGIEGLFHMDGRLWRTLPPLFFRPGLLAKDYMAGRIARHVPPFRTFLVSLLLFIFAAEALIHKAQHDAKHDSEHAETGHETKTADEATAVIALGNNDSGAKAKTLKSVIAEAKADQQAAHDAAKAHRDAELKTAKSAAEKTAIEQAYQKAVAEADAKYAAVVKNPETAGTPVSVGFSDVFGMSAKERYELGEKIKADTSLEENAGATHDKPQAKSTIDGFKLSLSKALQNPELFILNVFTLGHRLAVLLLPIMSLILGGLYFYRRQFFIFEHFLISCNLLSFMFLTNAFGFILPEIVRGYWFLLLMAWTPINIFMTLRGAYGSGIFGALIKTIILWTVTMLSFAALVVWLSWLAISAM